MFLIESFESSNETTILDAQCRLMRAINRSALADLVAGKSRVKHNRQPQGLPVGIELQVDERKRALMHSQRVETKRYVIS